MHPLNVIRQIRGIFQRYAKDTGGCLKFALFLWSVNKDVELWYNEEHVLSRYWGKFYDIDGEVYQTKGFMPLRNCDKDRILHSFAKVLSIADIQTVNEYYDQVPYTIVDDVLAVGKYPVRIH